MADITGWQEYAYPATEPKYDFQEYIQPSEYYGSDPVPEPRRPSILDAIKEGLYKGLTGASNPNPYASPYGTKPEEQRMAGTRTAEMSDFLKSAIAGLLETKLNTRNPSIYEGYLR